MRVQRRLCSFFLVCATHFFPTLRPPAGSVKVNVTLAGSLRLKENVVPTGGFFFFLLSLALRWASSLPSRQVLPLSLRLARIGATPVTTPAATTV